jgi:predicted nucleic acid-binding protein
MITVDSSVWIDYLKGSQTSQTKQLDAMLGDSSLDFVMLDVVLMEVLRGIRSDHEYKNTQEALTALPIHHAGGEATATHAAQIYRKLRRGGQTMRSSIDLLVASWCLHSDADLLHNDRDFAVIANAFPLASPINVF